MDVSNNVIGVDREPVSTVAIQCPRCGWDSDGLGCRVCSFRMRSVNGILHAIPLERMVHYRQFTEDYERIRASEGRGSQSEEFYLGLPYIDVSGRNNEQWQIRSKSFDHITQHVLKDVLARGNCRILDIGAGNCWMSYRFALAGHSPVAVDLLTNSQDGLGAAIHYRQHLPVFFPRVQAEMARLPFQAEQFDIVIFNASFHYSENYESTLGEAFRCVKKHGTVVISDTPWYSCEKSGVQMVTERHAAFLQRYGTRSDSVESIQYLTDERLRTLEERLSIEWAVHHPDYGLKWKMRPLMAKLCNRREPSRFRIYSARKNSRGD